MGLSVKDLAFSPSYLTALFIGSLKHSGFLKVSLFKLYLHSQTGKARGLTLSHSNFYPIHIGYCTQNVLSVVDCIFI